MTDNTNGSKAVEGDCTWAIILPHCLDRRAINNIIAGTYIMVISMLIGNDN